MKKSQAKHSVPFALSRPILGSLTAKTSKKSRWFVLKDFFLFYFKSQEVLRVLVAIADCLQEVNPIGFIVLDYFSCKLVEVNGNKSIQLRSSCTEFANHECIYLYSESDSELDEWFNIINKRVCCCENIESAPVPLFSYSDFSFSFSFVQYNVPLVKDIVIKDIAVKDIVAKDLVVKDIVVTL